MSGLFDVITEEQKGRLLARGWKRVPGSYWPHDAWVTPEGARLTEAEARAALARMEREETGKCPPPPGEPGACGSCNAIVRWVWTLGGKRMPLDPDPATDGNVVISGDGTAIVLKKATAAAHPGPKYRSHFSTCPQASAWRKR